jgi:hypothetical protein
MSHEQYSKKENSEQEGNKLLYDLLKHLTTLNTGAIILIATLLDKVFKTPVAETALISSVIGFTVSLTFAFLSMFFAANRVYYTGEKNEVPENIFIVLLLIAVTIFLISMGGFAYFSLLNFIA